jgi:hypothetical protein
MTAMEAPLIVYGDRNPQGTGAAGTSNPNRGPSVIDQGIAIYDGRAGYNVTRWGAIGWLGDSGGVCVLNQTPQTLTTTNIAGSQTATAGTALTLAAATTGITIVGSGGLVVWPSGNTVPANSLVLDGNPGLLSPLGAVAQPSSGNTMVSLYDPTKAISRNVRIVTNADDSAGTYTVKGYDIYGYPMSEAIAGVNTATASGKKAFKFITSITPSGTVNSTGVTVGTGDVFGFPLRVNTIGFTRMWWANTMATNLTTPFGTASAFTAADTTSPQTSTTGDPRGTIYIGTANASNATRTLQVYVTLDINAMTAAAGGIFGVTQA